MKIFSIIQNRTNQQVQPEEHTLHKGEVMYVKHINVVTVDGKEIDIETMSPEEKKKVAEELAREFVKNLGYQERTA